MTIEFWWRQIFEILIFHKPSLGSLDVSQKIWARSVQPFDVYWIQTVKQTDKQTNRQAKFIYRCCPDNFSMGFILYPGADTVFKWGGGKKIILEQKNPDVGTKRRGTAKIILRYIFFLFCNRFSFPLVLLRSYSENLQDML